MGSIMSAIRDDIEEIKWMRDRFNALQTELSDLQAENSRLREEIRQLKSGIQGAEGMTDLIDRSYEGLFVGQLNDRELKQFHRLCEAGLARRSYEGPLALFGLARVRFNNKDR